MAMGIKRINRYKHVSIHLFCFSKLHRYQPKRRKPVIYRAIVLSPCITLHGLPYLCRLTPQTFIGRKCFVCWAMMIMTEESTGPKCFFVHFVFFPKKKCVFFSKICIKISKSLITDIFVSTNNSNEISNYKVGKQQVREFLLRCNNAIY